MARRGRTPREPKVKEAIEFVDSPDIKAVAEGLISKYPAHFAWLRNFRVGFYLVEGSRRRISTNVDVGAKFRKVTGVYHGITGLDAVVEIHHWAWSDQNEPELRQALVSHVLCHGEMTEKGALRTVQHDLGEFRWVVANFGAWQPEIEQFEQQLSLFVADATTLPPAPADASVSIEAARRARNATAMKPVTGDVCPAIAAQTEKGPMPCTLPADHKGAHQYLSGQA